MYEPANQSLSVAALFGDAYKTIRPFGIRWKGKNYTITQARYRHAYRDNKGVIYVFSLTDGLNYFEFLVQAGEVHWMLGRLRQKQPNNRLAGPE